MLELSARTREAHLERLADARLDVLVIGGGITGAGIALDAAARGLAVGLVEREDFGSGTSGRSSRLIHGGARYLRHGEIGLVYESLRERRVLQRIAPHLVRPLGFLIPTPSVRSRMWVGLGLNLYDAVALGRTVAPHRWARPDRVSELAPTLRKRTGGYISFDCRTDDARLTLEIVRQAAARGALVANHAEVEAVIGDGAVRGVRVRDRANAGRLDVRARVTVNATGVWADRIAGLATAKAPRLRPSKGVHVVLDRARLPTGCAVMVPSVDRDFGLVFAIPWGPRVYLGTTDTPYHGSLEDPTVEDADVEILLGSFDRAFGGGVADAPVRASWAGVRPLLDTDRGSTRDLSRRHVIYEGPRDLLTVTGGKLTTYRAMAQDVVDHVCRRLGIGARSTTTHIALGLESPLRIQVDRAKGAVTGVGLPEAAGERLVQRYGDEWDAAVSMIRDDPALGEPAVEGLPVLRVELELARSREMALTDDDVLVRRTRLATMDEAAARSVSVG